MQQIPVERHTFAPNLYHGQREAVDTPLDYNTVLERQKVEEDLPTYKKAVNTTVMNTDDIDSGGDYTCKDK